MQPIAVFGHLLKQVGIINCDRNRVGHQAQTIGIIGIEVAFQFVEQLNHTNFAPFDQHRHTQHRARDKTNIFADFFVKTRIVLGIQHHNGLAGANSLANQTLTGRHPHPSKFFFARFQRHHKHQFIGLLIEQQQRTSFDVKVFVDFLHHQTIHLPRIERRRNRRGNIVEGIDLLITLFSADLQLDVGNRQPQLPSDELRQGNIVIAKHLWAVAHAQFKYAQHRSMRQQWQQQHRLHILVFGKRAGIGDDSQFAALPHVIQEGAWNGTARHGKRKHSRERLRTTFVKHRHSRLLHLKSRHTFTHNHRQQIVQ